MRQCREATDVYEQWTPEWSRGEKGVQCLMVKVWVLLKSCHKVMFCLKHMMFWSLLHKMWCPEYILFSLKPFLYKNTSRISANVSICAFQELCIHHVLQELTQYVIVPCCYPHRCLRFKYWRIPWVQILGFQSDVNIYGAFSWFWRISWIYSLDTYI